MSDAVTKRMLAPFIEEAPRPRFLSGFFKSPPQNFHNSQTVEIDIQRDGEDVAIAITDLVSGRRYNENGQHSNKEFEPPVFDETLVIQAHSLIKREAGADPFEDPDYQASAILRAFRGFKKLQNKIARAIELMASQVLSTGNLTLINAAGTSVFTMSFSPKGTHFTTPTAWAVGGGSGTPLADLSSLAGVIRADGRSNPDILVFGQGAWLRFLDNAAVQKALTRDGLGLGTLNPQMRGEGATFQGVVTVGAYQFQCWTYNGGYAHPQTGTWTPYVADNKVLMISSKARLDLSFGNIPIIMPEKRVLELPSRIMDSAGGIDLTVHSWLEGGGKQLCVSAGTRPLTIPTEIDSFGAITAF
jgi:hypothetical protein